MKKQKRKKSIPTPSPSVLYHFTSKIHYEMILASGYLKLTPSNLFPPDPETATTKYNYEKGIATYWDKNYDYKPVVWLTSNNCIDPEELNNRELDGLGLYAAKREVRIAIKKDPYHKRWADFANQHKMQSWWRKKLEEGMDHQSWYVSERCIPVCDFIDVSFLRKTESGIVYKKEHEE